MSKQVRQKRAWFCQECGAQSPKWVGKCSFCGSWNSYVEEVISSESRINSPVVIDGNKSSPVKISSISSDELPRKSGTDNELNRVLGGGIVPGSVILLGGEPGIGKSTLALQLALQSVNVKTLYVSGEESEQQISMRAKRIGLKNENCYILTETESSRVLKYCNDLKPELIIIDSIQTLVSDRIESVAGSVGQIRQCTAELQHFVKSKNIPLLLIGHITKDGHIAGPKVLEHMVDVVLLFEGDRHYGFRLLRSLKNRYGSTSELGIYSMKSTGLEIVDNPSELLLSQQKEQYSGNAVAATLEGIRPLLIEVQSLVSSAVYGTPQRSSTGFDLRRLNMLLAVLEKRCGFRLGSKDVFINITGGIKTDDPATDLAIVSAILSSGEDIVVPKTTCFAAEIGLTGEVRPVNRIEDRISEAKKLGFNRFFLSKYNTKGLKTIQGIAVIPVINIEDLIKKLFG